MLGVNLMPVSGCVARYTLKSAVMGSGRRNAAVIMTSRSGRPP